MDNYEEFFKLTLLVDIWHDENTGKKTTNLKSKATPRSFTSGCITSACIVP